MKKANNLKKLRQLKGMTLWKLSVQANVSVSLIQAIERYSYFPVHAEIRKKLSNALGIPENDIWNKSNTEVFFEAKVNDGVIGTHRTGGKKHEYE